MSIARSAAAVMAALASLNVVGPAHAQDAGYPVAGRELSHTRTDAFDHAGKFASGREWEWRLGLVLAGDDQRVEEVQSDRLDLGHDLAGAGDRIGNVRDLKVVGRTEMAAEDGFHGWTLGWLGPLP